MIVPIVLTGTSTEPCSKTNVVSRRDPRPTPRGDQYSALHNAHSESNQVVAKHVVRPAQIELLTSAIGNSWVGGAANGASRRPCPRPTYRPGNLPPRSLHGLRARAHRPVPGELIIVAYCTGSWSPDRAAYARDTAEGQQPPVPPHDFRRRGAVTEPTTRRTRRTHCRQNRVAIGPGRPSKTNPDPGTRNTDQSIRTDRPVVAWQLQPCPPQRLPGRTGK